jgi:hypothetical protein
MTVRIHPAHSLTFDPATTEGQAICHLYQKVTNDVASGDDWPGADLTMTVDRWFTDLGFDIGKPLTVDAMCPGSGENIQVEWQPDSGGFESSCSHCGRVMSTSGLDVIPDHEPVSDDEAQE